MGAKVIGAGVCGAAALVSTAMGQSSGYVATPLPPDTVITYSNNDTTPLDMSWTTIDGGGGTLTAGTFILDGTVGQPDAGAMSGAGSVALLGGFWPNFTASPPCYANCDGSTQQPVLNVGDFTCFLQKYAAGDPYANCDGSTQAPVLNVGDFTCFLQAYANGCPAQ